MNDASFLLAVARMSFLSLEEKERVRNNLDNLKDLTLLSIEDISVIVGRHVRTRLWCPQTLERDTERDMRLMQAYGIQWCVWEDSRFPPLLREIYDPPFAVFWRGSLPDAECPAVAVVGTRRPTGAGMDAAFSVGKELGEAGVAAVSGLALGIDACAHRGNLAGGGKTVAVLACGPDRLYPSANGRLARAVIENGGCILSEYAPGTPPAQWRFPQRNRLISALSRTVAVVEAPAGSGALITADFALEQGRDVCLHEAALSYPGPLFSAGKSSVLSYAEDGAPVIRNAQDIFDLWRRGDVRGRAGCFPGGKQCVFDFEREAYVPVREKQGCIE